MSEFENYFSGYWNGLKSLLVGMRTSIRVYFRKDVTEQYPENRHTTLHILRAVRKRLSA